MNAKTTIQSCNVKFLQPLMSGTLDAVFGMFFEPEILGLCFVYGPGRSRGFLVGSGGMFPSTDFLVPFFTVPVD